MRLLGVVVLAGALLTAGQAQAAPPGPAPTGVVTLITGDRVLTGQRAVTPAPGRENVLFTTYTAQGHEYVVPADAMPLIAAGKLDERLFDVTELATYDGALPVIATYPEGTARTLSAGRQLPSINAVAFDAAKTPLAGMFTSEMSSNAMSAFDTSGIKKIWLDGRVRANLDVSVPQINAPAAYEEGFTGKGTTVAVLDTGVDNAHPDLADREIGERNFTASPDNIDRYGHGTHVASIIAGTGAKSGGRYRGVAPDARILDVKVLNDTGGGFESEIIAGMEWAVEQGAQVVNMSLGGTDSPEVEPMEEAVNRLTAEKGTLFVIAAGNEGPAGATIGTPGSADAALTVGAVDSADDIADFSSRGPTAAGTLKPDLTAPGDGIVAALHTAGTAGPPAADGYVSFSGTSMAAPHVAGAAALLREQHPELPGTELKARLVGNTTPNPALTPFDQGTGRVDLAKVITQDITATPTNITFGSHPWPHTGKPALTQEITYSNAGSETVTLDLTAETNGSVFSVSPARLTVPAGGSATATVSADIAQQPDGGVVGGAIVANGLRTAVVVDLERESHEITITYRDRSGAKPLFGSSFLINADTGERFWPDVTTGAVRVFKGRYMLSGSTYTQAGNDSYSDVINYPNLTVTSPATIELDARVAKPVQVTLPVEARLSVMQTGFERTVGDTSYVVSNFTVSERTDNLGVASIGPGSPEVLGQTSTYWTSGSDFYGLAWYTKGAAPKGVTKKVSYRDLAKVRVDMPSLQPDDYATVSHVSSPAGKADWGWGWGSLDRLQAGPRTEYYGGEGGDWSRQVSLIEATGGVISLATPPKHYRIGVTYVEPFNRAVFGPALPPTRGVPHAFRNRNSIGVNLPLHGDSAGNAGYSPALEGTTTLYRDDRKIADSGEAGKLTADVPRGPGKYRLETTSLRHQRLSSTVSAVWTFDSDTTAGQTALPLSVVRFTPKLDDGGYARAGKVLHVPVSTQSQSGSVKVTSVEVSYDGGTTWRGTQLRHNHLLLTHPKNAKSVSLRAKASGSGQTVEMTIIDAYLLR
ncbi:Serine protease, subtilisin family [Lentzea fradiae]|uniref:Serine protease, subtilisin family n=1 Tax=Lentzea fradiae TaxID=200378 RepID=A0A1G7NXQ6_9PSEU|nr:Serine protease, subtilisin family [Lentzea fradiae]